MRWQGFSEEHDTWETESNVMDPELLDELARAEGRLGPKKIYHCERCGEDFEQAQAYSGHFNRCYREHGGDSSEEDEPAPAAAPARAPAPAASRGAPAWFASPVGCPTLSPNSFSDGTVRMGVDGRPWRVAWMEWRGHKRWQWEPSVSPGQHGLADAPVGSSLGLRPRLEFGKGGSSAAAAASAGGAAIDLKQLVAAIPTKREDLCAARPITPCPA